MWVVALRVHTVVGVMKMGNIVPRGGIEPTSLVFQAGVLPLLPTCHHYTHTHLCVQLLASEVSADYYTGPPKECKFVMLTIIYIQAMALHVRT